MAGDKSRFNAFFHGMLDEGVYFAPAAFEAGFVSAHARRRGDRRDHRGGATRVRQAGLKRNLSRTAAAHFDAAGRDTLRPEMNIPIQITLLPAH